jgi:hypothetical protein
VASKEALAHLGQHPAWDQLRQLAKERADEETHRLAAALLRGETVTPEEIAYTRGFLKGCQWLLANPAMEARKLRQELGVEGG